MGKRKCTFSKTLKEEFPFLKDDTTSTKVECTLCRSVFSIEHGGRADITQHIKKKKHMLAVSARTSSSITSFVSRNGLQTEEDKRIAAEEGLFAFHTAKHNHSFRSMDCTSLIIRELFEKKFTCSRTKCESILVNVLSPYAMHEVQSELEDAKYVSVMVDASNHKSLKLVPILVRYFIPTKGVQCKVICFQNVGGETAELLANHVLDILKKHHLVDKIIAFCADNCNTNFGGYKRAGTNNVFSKLNSVLKMNIQGIGCAAHVVHNGVQTSADILPIDIETVVNKIFQYFHIYTVRVEELKLFCDFVATEYKQVLGSVKTRWLSLLPGVTRVIDIYEPLKSYFMSQDRCPTLLKQFFENPQSLLWLHFIQSQLKMFSNSIQKLERTNISATEVAEELELLTEKVNNRKCSKFQTSVVSSILINLENEGLFTQSKYETITNLFYDTFLSYLNKWVSPYQPLKSFHWITLKNSVSWDEVLKSLKILKTVDSCSTIQVHEDELFDEIGHVNKVLSRKFEEWEKVNVEIDKKWCDVFHILKSIGIPCKNIEVVVSFALAVPGTNAVVERVFSIVNSLWIDERNRFTTKTIQAIVILKTHFQDLSCKEFYNLLLSNSKLLRDIRSCDKYKVNSDVPDSEATSSCSAGC